MDESLSERMQRLDVDRMLESLTDFTDDLRSAFTGFDDQRPDWLDSIRERHPSGILCLGMGGSGACGRFLQTLCDADGLIPVAVWRDYGVPSWISPDWLVIATSYSGNTEETLDAAEKALAADCTVLTISSGGTLAGLSEMHPRAHQIFVPGGRRPRAAFGHLFGTQVALLWMIGILERPLRPHLGEMLSRLQDRLDACDFTADEDSSTARLARGWLQQRRAIIASPEMAAAGERFTNQLNENAARFARCTIIPEMNHNEIVAWGGKGIISDQLADEQAVLVIDSPLTSSRVARRIDWFVHNLTTSVVWRVRAEGETLLEQLLHLCIMMDWTSSALALLRDKNPAATPGIDGLKRHLSEGGPQ